MWTKGTGAFVKTAEDSFIDERNDEQGKRCKVGLRLKRQRKVFDMESTKDKGRRAKTSIREGAR